MKKLMLTVAIVVGGMSTYALNSISTFDVVVSTITKEEFKEISFDQLTESIVTAFQKDYASATLNKAYVNSSEQYKLVVTVDEAEQTLYIDKDGNWLEETDIIVEE